VILQFYAAFVSLRYRLVISQTMKRKTTVINANDNAEAYNSPAVLKDIVKNIDAVKTSNASISMFSTNIKREKRWVFLALDPIV